MKKSFALAATIALVVSLFTVLPAQAAVDPYPALSTGDELPGTRIWSTTETSWADFATTTYSLGWACPVHATPNGDPYAMDGNGFDQAVGKWWRACFKNPWRVYDKAAWDAYYAAVEAAKQAAFEESLAWNQANPGRQKCIPYGPFTDPYGGQSSGGVCANPVSAPVAPSGSPSVAAEPVAAAPVVEADISTTSSSPSVSSSVSASAPVVNPLPVDPTPSGGSDYRGSGYPFTVTIEGQTGADGCPVGFRAASGLIADLALRKVFTECWPERAWAAYRLGGEAWDLYKATGGSYDPTVEIDRRNKVALLKARAKAVAETAAAQTPGIERCSSWSGFGESGRECAYAFVSPGSASPIVVVPVSQSVQVSASPSVTSSPSQAPVSVSAQPEAAPETTASPSVELSAVVVSGSSVAVARQALLITPDTTEASSISALANSITAVRSVQRTTLQALPRDPTLTYSVVSLTPGICQASTFRVRINRPGLCQLEIQITDSVGNEYEITKRVRRL